MAVRKVEPNRLAMNKGAVVAIMNLVQRRYCYGRTVVNRRIKSAVCGEVGNCRKRSG